jgi:transcriptional regulator with XRE-family HTH domain
MKTLNELIDTLNPDEVSKRLGCAKSAVNHWRNGTRKPGPRMIRKIVKEFGLTVQAIRPDLFS